MFELLQHSCISVCTLLAAGSGVACKWETYAVELLSLIVPAALFPGIGCEIELIHHLHKGFTKASTFCNDHAQWIVIAYPATFCFAVNAEFFQKMES